MKIYAGTSGFGHKEWKGKFYPEKISAGQMLGFYARLFNAVEINNTFYHMPKADVLSSWAEQVKDHDRFVFAVKAPQMITHVKRLKNVRSETDYFFRSLSTLGTKLGPVLFQFPASFRQDYPALEEFLNLLPDGASCAFDFRSPTWHEPEIFDLLKQKGCSLCLEDTDERPVSGMVSTTSWGYVRLRRSDYTDQDIAKWAERIRAQKWGNCFVFFKHEEEAKGPEMAKRFLEFVETGTTAKRRAV